MVRFLHSGVMTLDLQNLCDRKGDTNTTCSKKWYNRNGYGNPKVIPHCHSGQGFCEQEYSAFGS